MAEENFVGLSLALQSESESEMVKLVITRFNYMGSKRVFFSLSPPASPLPSPPTPPKKSIYMFYEHDRFDRSSYRIDIDLKESKSKTPCLLLEFRKAEFPVGMRCAKLRSKLYLLGGAYDDGRDLPRQVYQFDTSTEELKTMDAPLNAGKPRGSVVFAANGKLYALSPLYLGKGIFECFDHATNKWLILKDLPQISKNVWWQGCTVFKRRQQVVLIGSTPSGSNVKFFYHLRGGRWSRHTDFNIHAISYDVRSSALSFEEGGNDYVYGLLCGGPPIKSKRGHVNAFDNIDLVNGKPVVGLCYMSLNGLPTREGSDWAKWVYAYFPHPQPCIDGATNRFLRYLGSNHFCYLASSYNRHFDAQTRGITITLFKESGEGEGEGEKLFSGIEILHFHGYDIDTTPVHSMHAKLVGCFVVTPEQLEKKKKKKNNKIQPFESTRI